MLDNLLKEKDAAQHIGMSVSYLQHARCYGVTGGGGSGPVHIKLGRSVRYRVSDLERWIKENTVRSRYCDG